MDYMNFLEPIALEDFKNLKSGEWIWDGEIISRRTHDYSIDYSNTIKEPTGFRQIHIINEYSKSFMLSDFESLHGGYKWVYFRVGRFYKFKKENNRGPLYKFIERTELARLRDNLLIEAGLIAAYMHCARFINLPCGSIGVDQLGLVISKAVDIYIEEDIDVPFDNYIEDVLKREYKVD